jgi:hypothetical protein
LKIEELGIGKKKKYHLLYKAFEDVENVPVWQELCVGLFVCLFSLVVICIQHHKD